MSNPELPGLTHFLHDCQHVLVGLHFDAGHHQKRGLELGHLQLLHDGLEDIRAESLFHVFETVFYTLGHEDHQAQVVREL